MRFPERAMLISLHLPIGWSYELRVSALDKYPSAVAAKIARVSPKTLMNWRNRRILLPTLASGPSPQPCLYTFRDLVAIRVVATLRDAGIDLRGLRRVVEYIRARKGISVTDVLPHSVLITDGHEVFEINETASLSVLLRLSQGAFHGVVLHALVREVQLDARALVSAAA